MWAYPNAGFYFRPSRFCRILAVIACICSDVRCVGVTVSKRTPSARAMCGGNLPCAVVVFHCGTTCRWKCGTSWRLATLLFW